MRVTARWALMILLVSSRAWSESPRGAACAGPRIHLAPELALQRSWTAAVDAASTRLAELGEVDDCAILDVQWNGSEANVRVSRPDGRVAVRRVTAPKQLTSTVVALLALPHRPSDAVASSSPSASGTAPPSAALVAARYTDAPATDLAPAATARSASSAPLRNVRASDVPPASDTSATELAQANDSSSRAPSGSLGGAPIEPGATEVSIMRREGADHLPAYSSDLLVSEVLGVELGLGARASGAASGAFGVGATAFASARSGKWLFGLSGHGERLQHRSVAGAPVATASSWAVGIAVGRRLIDGPVSLDLLLVPAEVAVTTTRRSTSTSATSLGLSGGLAQSSDDGSESSGSDDAVVSTPPPGSSNPPSGTTTNPPPPPSMPPPPPAMPPVTTTTVPIEPPPPPVMPPSQPQNPAPVTATPSTPMAPVAKPAAPPTPAPVADPNTSPTAGVLPPTVAISDVQEITTTELRMAAALRASTHFTGPFRWFAELNGNVSPMRLAREVQPGEALGLMPRWTAGLSVGLLWSPP